MKKILFFIGLAAVVASTQNNSLAQTPVVGISGTNCVGGTLLASSSIQPAKIVWKQNGNAIDSVFNTWLSGAATVAGQSSGTSGSGANQLNGPVGIFVDGSGNVYVADQSNNRVQKWAPGTTSGITVAGQSGGTSGNAANQLHSPYGVFVDGSSNVYVADDANNRVQKWAPGATSGTTVAGQSNGTAGSAANQLSGPAGIFVDGNGNVYVADDANNRVQKWASGATSGITVAGQNNGTAGSAANQLSGPAGIFVDGNGNVYVADVFNNRVQKWAAGATSGSTVAGGNGSGNNLNQLNAPMGIYVDGNGNIYIDDAGNNRIQLWASGATSGTTVAGGNGVGANNNQFSNPDGVFVDGFGNLFVADGNNNRIQEFAPTITYTDMAFSSGNYTASVTTFTGASATTSVKVVSDTLMPGITITALNGPNGQTFCNGETINFMSSILNGGSAPAYQWMQNGLAISGAISATFSSATLANNDAISCVLSPNIVCPTLLTATSDTITVTVSPHVMPMVALSLNAGDTICVGQTVTFSANALNGGSGPQFTWTLNADTIVGPVINSSTGCATKIDSCGSTRIAMTSCLADNRVNCRNGVNCKSYRITG